MIFLVGIDGVGLTGLLLRISLGPGEIPQSSLSSSQKIPCNLSFHMNIQYISNIRVFIIKPKKILTTQQHGFALHSGFSSTSKGPYVALAATGDVLGTS